MSFDQWCRHESTSICQTEENKWQEGQGLKRGVAWVRSALLHWKTVLDFLALRHPDCPPTLPSLFLLSLSLSPLLISFGDLDQQYVIFSRFLQCLGLDYLLRETPAFLIIVQFINVKQKCWKIFKNKKFLNPYKLEKSKFANFGSKWCSHNKVTLTWETRAALAYYGMGSG